MEQQNALYADQGENEEFYEENIESTYPICERCGLPKAQVYTTENVFRGGQNGENQEEEVVVEGETAEENKEVLRGPNGMPLLGEILSGGNLAQEQNNYNNNIPQNIPVPAKIPVQTPVVPVAQPVVQPQTQNIVTPPQQKPIQPPIPQHPNQPPMQKPIQPPKPYQPPQQVKPPVQKPIQPVYPPQQRPIQPPKPVIQPPQRPIAVQPKMPVVNNPIRPIMPPKPKIFPPSVIPPRVIPGRPPKVGPTPPKIIMPVHPGQRHNVFRARKNEEIVEEHLCPDCQTECLCPDCKKIEVSEEVLCPDCASQIAKKEVKEVKKNENEIKNVLKTNQKNGNDVDIDNYRYHEINVFSDKNIKSQFVVKKEGVVIASNKE